MKRQKAEAIIRGAELQDDLAEVLCRHLEPQITIRATRMESGELALGASRLGGTPDLPGDVPWPTWNDEPLSFVAQIDMRDCHPFDIDRSLPAEGWLVFFYDAKQGVWGFDPEDRDGFRVLYVQPESELQRLEMPEGMPKYARFLPSSVAFASGWSILCIGDGLLEKIELPEERLGATMEAMYEIVDSVGSGSAANHHFLGHPEIIQNDMRLGCQLVSNGIYCGKAEGYRDPRVEDLRPGVSDWRLLLQLDSDWDGPKWMWGDAGMIYFWIREQDLAARAFDKAWVALQCT